MKKYLPLAILSTTFVLLLLFLSTRNSLNFVEEQKIVPSVTPAPTEIKWQTYRNEKYGFEFQYPSVMSELASPEGTLFMDSNNSQNQINFSVIKSSSINKIILALKSNYGTVDKEEINLNGETFTKLSYNTKVAGPIVELYIEKNNDVLVFTNNVDILSTFKFFNPILSTVPDTSTWKTYKDDKWGITFKYPSDYFYEKNKVNSSLPIVYFWKNGSNTLSYYTKFGEGSQTASEVTDFPYFEISLMGNSLTALTSESTDGPVELRFVKDISNINPLFKVYSSGQEMVRNVCASENLSKHVFTITCDDSKLRDPIFTQILTTLKFIQPVFCGGIAAIACPPGYKCILDGQYPDAGGKCVQ